MAQRLSQQWAYPAASEFAQFSQQVAHHLQATESGWLYRPKNPGQLMATRDDQQHVQLDLTPFYGQNHNPDAATWFNGVKTLNQLIAAYQQAKATCIKESDEHVHHYAKQYLARRLRAAHEQYSDQDAQRIARWVSQLDVYAAVKSVECLLDNYDNLALFKVADEQGWQILFDHLAIRCGSAHYQHAEQLIQQLKTYHGYEQCQLEKERFYQFDDGWNAYPLYKMLNNGQVIRLFIDQSDADNNHQIIQHWNHCYGFTAHHLALRAVHFKGNQCHAVPLQQVINALDKAGITSLTPTGFYTHGLLEQVFLKPLINPEIPEDIHLSLAKIDPKLNRTIQNGKLIELVSRRELPQQFIEAYLALYGLNKANTPVSTPIYPYFLPAQAAHVIRTSIHHHTKEG